jgi:hypothetical protein
MNLERIQQAFFILFTCETKELEMAAIRELLSLGLTKDQINSGIIAGAKYIKRRMQ